MPWFDRLRTVKLRQGTDAVPFTPFHFGPGILAKACCPQRYWLVPFILANVLIDCEVLYYLSVSQSPIHRYLHTYVGGFLAGGMSAILAYGGLRLFLRMTPASWCVRWRSTARRQLVFDAFVAGLVGGLSHIFLDSLMHRDMQPYWPFAEGNSLIGVVSNGVLHGLLAATALLGVVIWGLRRE